MPNIAFHYETLQKVIEGLDGAGDSSATLLKDNFRFALLGAMGSNLFEYLPASQTLLDSLEVISKNHQSITTLPPDLLEELFFRPSMAAYGLVFRTLVLPFWPVIANITDFLNQMDIVAQNEDADALKNMKQTTEDIQSQAVTLKNLGPVIQDLRDAIGQIVALPPWIQQAKAPSSPQGNRLYEFVRWHHTGDFARNLIDAADNDQQKAYALGYLVHVAASVTGEPFVNNIVGGPYRTHWWRNRLVRNFIDAWTFGFYESNAQPMKGDTPNPPYDQWKPLCSANLQDRINVGDLAGASKPDALPDAVNAVASGDLGNLPASFPKDLAEMIQKAVDASYPAALRPKGFDLDTYSQAFVGAYAVLWFMTSGAGPMCRNTIGTPPSSCSSPPNWVISGGAPPSPQQSGPSTAGTVTAILLAILALILFLTQNYAAGVGAVLGAIKAAMSGDSVDWDQLRCNLFWLRKELVDAENAIRDGLVWSGLAYPPPESLGNVDAQNQTHPVVDKTPANGIPLCRSQVTDIYPRQMDNSVPAPTGLPDLNFASYPKSRPVEEPSTKDFHVPNHPSPTGLPSYHYPDFVVNGAGLQNGGIMTDGAYPSRNQFFGDAVSNALDIFKQGPKGLPNYNLDADRGYGWKTWNPQLGTKPMNPPVQDKQEV